MRALCGLTPVVAGRVRRRGPFADPRRIGYVSFELHRRIMAREDLRAEARSFSGRLETVTTTAEVIGAGLPDCPAVRPAAEELDIAHLLREDITVLSSGEMRRVLIARALAAKPAVLVLDEPCQGLDPRNRRRIVGMLDAIGAEGTTLLYATHHRDELPACISHVLVLDGRGNAAVHAASTAPAAGRRDFN